VVDAVAVARHYCPKVIKSGSRYLALCIFHDDHNPSLSVLPDEKYFTCFACGFKGDVIAFVQKAEGITFPEAVRKLAEEFGVPGNSLRPTMCGHAPASGNIPEDWKLTATYPYTNEVGVLLFEKLRYEHPARWTDPEHRADKTFRIRCADGRPGLGKTRRVLYHLTQVVQAEMVLVCEGEKDCDTAKNLGYVATCNAFGAGQKWRREDSLALQGKERVLVIGDNDPEGIAHAARVKAHLKGIVPQVRTAVMPHGKDLTEWVEDGGTAEQFRIWVDEKFRQEESAPAVFPQEGRIIAALERFLCRYLVLPDRAALPLACWVAATYIYERFDTFPYLAVVSPAKRCGKTRLAEVLGCVALNPVLTTGISEAALFRLVDQGGCTLLLDEAEALREKRSERSQAIVSILNAGYRQGAHVYRCVPPKHDLQTFCVYGPKAVIAVGSLPDTVSDRSIVIRMRRKKPDEAVSRFLSKRAKAESEPLSRILEGLAATHGQQIEEVYEKLPAFPELSDRDEEIWQAIFAICEVLAPERACELQKAAIALSQGKAEADADDSLPLRLLADIRGLLGRCGEKVPSADLVAWLKDLPESPWGEPRRELTQARLARMLKPFGPLSRDIRLSERVVRGYLKAELKEAVTLYWKLESATGATTQ